jgi:hypothetical protein
MKKHVINLVTVLFLQIGIISCGKIPDRTPAAEPSRYVEGIEACTTEWRRVANGIWHTNFIMSGPIHITIALVHLDDPHIHIDTVLAQDTCWGRETTSSIARRRKATLAVNGDYWTIGGVPLGFTVIDGRLVTSPRFRTAIGFTTNKHAHVGMWTDQWSWYGRVRFSDGYTHPLTFQNLDCNPGWMCVYTAEWGTNSYGNSLSGTAEAVVNAEGKIIDIRHEEPGVPIPENGYVITARGTATNALIAHAKLSDIVLVEQTTKPDWRNLQCALSAGPRIIKDGTFYQDSLAPFPHGEDFTAGWKTNHYLYRHPRTAAAVSRDGKYLLLAVADGRQENFSIGITQKEMAHLLMRYGGYNGLDFDSGGSSTMVLNGNVVNHPSDGATADGKGGVERAVANALVITSRR